MAAAPSMMAKLAPIMPRREWLLAGLFLAVWPIVAALALVGTFTGLMWRLPWWPVLYAVPVAMWTVGGIWWWVRGPREPWQHAVRGFAQAQVGAFVIIDAVSLSGVLGHVLLSDGWVPGAAGVGGIGGFCLLGFSLGVVAAAPGPVIALVWAVWGGRWPRWCEWTATAVIAGWTEIAGLMTLTMSA